MTPMEAKEGDIRKWRGWTILWAGVIFTTSCTVIQSKAFVHTVSTAVPGTLTEQGFQSFWSSWWWLFVKGYHVLEFAILTTLLATWLRGRPWWVATVAAGLYAASDEVHQIWVPQRGARVTDWLIDLVGVAIATAICVALRRRGTAMSAGHSRRIPALQGNQAGS